MKKVIKGIAIVACLIACTVLGLYVFQDKIIFLSETLPQDHQFQFDESFEEISLNGSEGAVLHGLHFKAKNPRGIIVYFHGNAGTLEDWGGIASFFIKERYDVLMMDYRGYGKSRGTRNENAFYSDAAMFYDLAKQWFVERQITVYGRSLGTTFATYVAAHNNPRKLVLESPFYSLHALAKARYPKLPVSSLLKYEFNTATFLKKVDCRVTIIHGTDDGVVPFEQGAALFELLPPSNRQFVGIKNGKHNNLNSFQEYWLAIRKELAY